jgi:assimilatory nitrate reductase catalytic subunit
VGRDRRAVAAPGKTAVEMFQAAADGEIKALWIVCTNPAQSLPDQAMVRRALQRCRVRRAAGRLRAHRHRAHADLLLPASSWGEKDGTVTNSERRISRVRARRAAARAGARRLADRGRRGAAAGARCRRAACAPGRSHAVPVRQRRVGVERAPRDHARRDLDITGLSWAALDTPAAVALPEGAPRDAPACTTDGRFATPDGRARFVAPAWRPVAERATRASPSR